jgi:hypothetical protein
MIRTLFAAFGAITSICLHFSLQIHILFGWLGFLMSLLGIFAYPPGSLPHVSRFTRYFPLRIFLITLVGFCVIGSVIIGNFPEEFMPPSPIGDSHEQNFYLDIENPVGGGKTESLSRA